MRVACGLAVLLTTVGSVASAQSTTADGVRALVEGDYAAAARILHPLAEASATPDPLAQFFLATLYQNGTGVRLDHVRACGLFWKSATAQHPLRDEALAIVDWFQDQMAGLIPLCEGAAMNVWGTPAPVTFTLAPDQWVSFDGEQVTVGYQGSQKSAEVTMGGPGWVYLPTRHTRIEARSTGVRHFIEFFVWVPRSSRYDPFIADNAAWTLQWMLSEVVGLEFFILAAGAPLATSEEDQPSIRSPIQDLARIRMNAAGQIEWVAQGAFPGRGVLIGPGPR